MRKKSQRLMLCGLVMTVALGSAARGDLLGRWKLDETSGTVAADSSGTGLDGTLRGGGTWVAGRIGGAWQGDGADDYIDLGNSATLDLSGAGQATIAAWVNPAVTKTHNTIITKGEWRDAYSLLIKGDTNPPNLLWTGNDTPVFSADPVPLGEWTHVAVTINANLANFYINGKLNGPADQDRGQAIDNNPADHTEIGREDRSDDGTSARWYFNGMLDDVRLYNEALPEEQIAAIMLGRDTGLERATDPTPADGQTDVPRDVVVGWKPGPLAAAHDVYFGVSFEDVNNASQDNPLNVLVSAGQDANTYDPTAVLEFDQTYYWRVDEVNAAPDFTVFKGPAWSFTAEPFSYPITNITATASSAQAGMEPENTINGSGLNADDQHSTEPKEMWLGAGTTPNWIQYEFDKVYKLHELEVWNSNQLIELIVGFGARDVTVEYSADGAEWTVVEGVAEFARATGSPDYTANTVVDFGGITAKYVKLTIHNSWGGSPRVGLSEVRFSHIPVRAREPMPASGQTAVKVDASLSWRPGREAASHQVSFGTDQQAVLDGTAPVQTVSENSFDPGALNLGTTYYWSVAEVNDTESPAVWSGDVWSFTLADSLTIDDFESYTDDEGNRIYETWIDGFADDSSGSTVGHLEAPFAEQTIVHGGRQSMPLECNNVDPPFYSETWREFSPEQDWTVHGINALVLWLRGNPAAFLETADGTITMSAWGSDIYGTADQCRFAYKSLSGDGTIVARVESIDNSDPWAKGGVMIRETLEPGSRFAIVCATPSNGVRFQARLMTGGGATSDTAVATPEQIALQTPIWVKLERSGNSFSGFYSTDGVNWTAMSWNPQAMNMAASTVYIGLALTSHNINAPTTAVFSNVATSGGVTGQWQTAEIGADHPANSPQLLYITVEDDAGKAATAVHPDPAATLTSTWTEWQIPLSSFPGVNLGRIRKMYVGTGDRSNPQPNGTSNLYIDDIQIGSRSQ